MAWQFGGLVLGAVLVGVVALVILAGIVLWLHTRRARRHQSYVEHEETPAQQRVRHMHRQDRYLDATQPIPRHPR
ncbi:hypothetical protein BAY61_31875 (plasmid) [Prauserella marina]|uniref:Uncharacterized protein n=1 Tax=Prauserella marina TaxID=530584 RepID=A0A222W105_9PSEU|nr:hypothetical protein [Prauserella marina]ASR39886.1 hypothetical protein BAY61_31875 [Prauserella marina]PWV71381.1 hypothetical protein DES30_11297 [Prauserella marina]SDD95378.1 hypothetical protein SAMN05421630_11515 [Prauserella marina]